MKSITFAALFCNKRHTLLSTPLLKVTVARPKTSAVPDEYDGRVTPRDSMVMPCKAMGIKAPRPHAWTRGV